METPNKTSCTSWGCQKRGNHWIIKVSLLDFLTIFLMKHIAKIFLTFQYFHCLNKDVFSLVLGGHCFDRGSILSQIYRLSFFLSLPDTRLQLHSTILPIVPLNTVKNFVYWQLLMMSILLTSLHQVFPHCTVIMSC